MNGDVKYSSDELVAMGKFLLDCKIKGHPQDQFKYQQFVMVLGAYTNRTPDQVEFIIQKLAEGDTSYV